MYLDVTVDGVVLHDADNLTSLAVHSGLSESALGAALGARGIVDGDHVWLDRAALIAAGPDREDWRERACAMLDGAAAHGWANPEGTHIRAHIVRPDAGGETD